MDILRLIQIFNWAIKNAIPLIAIPLFIIVSIVLFIRDGILAKRKGTGRKVTYTVMFIISMTIIALVIIIGILLFTLIMRDMRGM